MNIKKRRLALILVPALLLTMLQSNAADKDNILALGNCRKAQHKSWPWYADSLFKIGFKRCPPWRAKRRRVVPGSREATRDTRRAEGAKGDPKGASERGVQSYGRPVCSRNELAMLWRNAG